MKYEIGDKVSHYIPGHGVAPGESWVIGVPSFSDGGHVMLADERAHGMPINICHCTKIGGGDPDSAHRWRARYLAMYPGALKP